MPGVSRAGRRSARAKATPPSQAAVATAPRQSKQAAVIALLRRPEGVTVAEIVAASGWQPHTVRGLFSGPLRKKRGLELIRPQEKARGGAPPIVDPAEPPPAAEAS